MLIWYRTTCCLMTLHRSFGTFTFIDLCTSWKAVSGCLKVYVQVALLGTAAPSNLLRCATRCSLQWKDSIRSQIINPPFSKARHLRASDPPCAEIRPPITSLRSMLLHFCSKPQHLPYSCLIFPLGINFDRCFELLQCSNSHPLSRSPALITGGYPICTEHPLLSILKADPHLRGRDHRNIEALYEYFRSHVVLVSPLLAVERHTCMIAIYAT